MPAHALSYRMIDARGPRFCVVGSIRSGESLAEYADTGEQAERIRERYAGYGYYQIQVHPPVGSVDLGELGRARREAKEHYDEATAVLRAAVLRALEDGRTETEVADTAGVDRQTVRAWAGKQPMNRRQPAASERCAYAGCEEAMTLVAGGIGYCSKEHVPAELRGTLR